MISRRLHLSGLVLAGAIAVWMPALATAQTPTFGILDNSFLVEEAFNQDKGTVQNIFGWMRSNDGVWQASFTQEWPVLVARHQLSYSLSLAGGGGATGHFGATQLHYRYQILEEGPGHPAFAPRITAILPTGSRVDASDRPGVQVNLPFSKQAGNLYLHGNAGLTWIHAVPLSSGTTLSLTSPQLAGSVVWNTRPLFNLLAESVLTSQDTGTGHTTIVIVSPGFRAGWNRGESQIVVGAAAPVTMGAGETRVSALLYGSYELPFSKNP